MVFGNEGTSSNHWQTQETAKVIIALADRVDASTEQNTSRQGGVTFAKYIYFIAMQFQLPILYI